MVGDQRSPTASAVASKSVVWRPAASLQTTDQWPLYQPEMVPDAEIVIRRWATTIENNVDDDVRPRRRLGARWAWPTPGIGDNR